MNNISKLDALQIETIVNRLVPLIAAPKDHALFRFIIATKAEELNSADFACFIAQLLKEAQAG